MNRSHCVFLIQIVFLFFADQSIVPFRLSGGAFDSTDEDKGIEDEELQGSTLSTDLVNADKIELEVDEINNLSDEEEGDCYTSKSCNKTLAKVRHHIISIFQ